jgi:hypothetical protein
MYLRVLVCSIEMCRLTYIQEQELRSLILRNGQTALNEPRQ